MFLLQSFHGAARLTFGQKSDPVTSTSTTSTSAMPSTTLPPPETTVVTQQTDEPVDDPPVAASSSLSSAQLSSDITHNGQRRSSVSDFSKAYNKV